MFGQLNLTLSTPRNIKVEIFTSLSCPGKNAFKEMMHEMMKIWMSNESNLG